MPRFLKPVIFINLVLFSIASLGQEIPSDTSHMNEPITLPLVIQQNDSISTVIKNKIRKDPNLVDKSNGIKYHIRIYNPDPNIDYKILKVIPDPSIDYKILIYDPTDNKIDTKTEDLLNQHYHFQKKFNKKDSIR